MNFYWTLQHGIPKPVNFVTWSFYCSETSEDFVYIVLTICDAFCLSLHKCVLMLYCKCSCLAIQLVNLYMKVICLSSISFTPLALTTNKSDDFILLLFLAMAEVTGPSTSANDILTEWSYGPLWTWGGHVYKIYQQSLAEVCSGHWTKLQCCRCCGIEPSLVSRIQEGSSCHLQIVMGMCASPGIDWNIEIDKQSTIEIPK